MMMIDYMKKLGFSEYEIKAYFALLKNFPVNGYGLSKSSGIPRSRIYEVVEGLIVKGVVFQQIEEKTKLFTPLAPNLLMRKLKSEYDVIFDEVGAYAMSLYKNKNLINETRSIIGRNQIIDLVKLLIQEANHRIALSIWDEELKEIEMTLSQKEQEGVFIRGIYFGHDSGFDTLTIHRRVSRYIAEKSERYLVVIIDNRAVVSGVISKGSLSTATWSEDPHEVDMKDDFIAHDVMINAYSKCLEDNESYEVALDLIRKEYFCFSEDDYETFKDT